MWQQVYLCQDERPLREQVRHAEAAQAGDEEGVVGLGPVAAHHLHRYPCRADSVKVEGKWVTESDEARQ